MILRATSVKPSSSSIYPRYITTYSAREKNDTYQPQESLADYGKKCESFCFNRKREHESSQKQGKM